MNTFLNKKLNKNDHKDDCKNNQKGAMGIILAVIVVVITLGAIFFVQFSTKDLVDDENGNNINTGSTNATSTASSTNPSGTNSPGSIPSGSDIATNCGFTILSHAKNATVEFPLTISGMIDSSNYQKLGCAWGRFEGQGGTAEVFANIGGTWKNVGTWKEKSTQKPIMLGENWMSTSSPFSITLFLNEQYGRTNPIPPGTAMKVVFVEDNASGMPNPDRLELPLVYAGLKGETMQVKLFFRDMFHATDCGQTYAVTRTVPKSAGIADASLRALFTEDVIELKDTYLNMAIENGVAKVNFKPAALTHLNGAACMQTSVKSPIEKTLLQYPTIKKVDYYFNGVLKTDWDA